MSDNPRDTIKEILDSITKIVTDTLDDVLASGSDSSGWGEKSEGPTIKLVKLHESAQIPERKHNTDSGADVRWCTYAQTGSDRMEIDIKPHETVLLSTGLRVAHIEPGYEIQVRPRSGLAVRESLTVLNSPGTIDEGYRGEVMIILHNAGTQTRTIKHGERIAQLVVQRYEKARFEEVSTVSQTERGESGFGSTGKQ